MNKNYAVLFTALVAVSGAFGVSAFSGSSETQANPTSTGTDILGHVTMTVANPDGVITEYRQSDNFILRQGEDCIAKYLFAGTGETSGTSTTCPQTIGQFNNIVLLNGTSCATAETDTALTDTSCTVINDTVSNGFDPVACSTLTLTAATTTTGTHVDCNASFTNVGGNANVIQAAALINNTAGDANTKILAKQDVSGGEVSVGVGSTLVVEWDLDIGGTTTTGGETE